jgi:hypothetical protein
MGKLQALPGNQLQHFGVAASCVHHLDRLVLVLARQNLPLCTNAENKIVEFILTRIDFSI